MKMGPKGENLIFLLSQSRSGSTMLQRILGCHSQIHTATEPTFLFNPLRALRPDGYVSSHAGEWVPKTIRAFLKILPGGEEEYFEGLRQMAGHIYDRALQGSGKRYFLDKTTPYYAFVIPELYRTFPEAHFIILFRNPVAVLCSTLTTFGGADHSCPSTYQEDLVRTPPLLLEGIKLIGEKCSVIHYEHLVNEPEHELRRVCDKLGLRFEPEIVGYGSHGLPRWAHGDQVGVYQHTRPDPSHMEKWRQTVKEPQVWRLARDYLELLGNKTIERTGYSYEELRRDLEACRPGRIPLLFTFSFDQLSNRTFEQNHRREPFGMRFARSLYQRGFWKTLGRVMGKVILVVKKGRGVA